MHAHIQFEEKLSIDAAKIKTDKECIYEEEGKRKKKYNDFGNTLKLY